MRIRTRLRFGVFSRNTSPNLSETYLDTTSVSNPFEWLAHLRENTESRGVNRRSQASERDLLVL